MTDVLSGLSPGSRAILSCYQQWSRLAYDGLRRNVHLDASNHQVGNILQETYTREEVRAIISAHTAVLLHSLDARMQQFTSASTALLFAILRDADRQRTTIEIDANVVLLAAPSTTLTALTPTTTTTTTNTTITTITNTNAGGGGLLDEEELRLLNGPRGRLAPLTVADAAGVAQTQLEEANAEIRRLQEKLHRLSDEYTRVMENRTTETEQLRNMRDTLATTTSATATATTTAERELRDGDLQQTVRQLRAEVAAVRQELSTRLSQSTQYQQLKRILVQKNEQIKTMRARLMQYDPMFLSSDTGVVAEAEEMDL